MPFPSGPTSPDAQITTLRDIAAGEVLPADHPVASNLSALGHVEHDGEAWQLTDQGVQVVTQVVG